MKVRTTSNNCDLAHRFKAISIYSNNYRYINNWDPLAF